MNTTENADRYRRLAEGFSARVAAVPDDAWNNPSPCEGWTAREVLRHVVDSEHEFPAKAGVELDKGPSVDDDPVAAWEQTRAQVQELLDDPARADLEYDSAMGKSTLSASFGTFFSVDLIVHGWDIAHAAGIDDTIPSEDVEFVSKFTEGVGDMMRSPGGFGPALDAPDDADPQTTLLAYLGRSA